MKKNLFYIFILALFILVGCSNTSTLPEKVYSEELKDIFPSQDKTSIYFDGIAEYGHVSTLKESKESNDGYTIKYSGIVLDGLGDDDKTFQASYQITDSEITETIILNDRLRPETTKTLNSIIPNKKILKLPLTAANTWDYRVVLENEDEARQVTTTILSVEYFPQYEVKVITTFSVIEDIEGYSGNQYWEKRTYATGYGLIAFENSLPIYYDENDNPADFIMEFSYSMTGYTKKPYSKDTRYQDLILIYDELEDYFTR